MPVPERLEQPRHAPVATMKLSANHTRYSVETSSQGDGVSTCGQALAAPKVSVIIPIYNAADTIGDQLQALAAQNYGGWWEVVAVDNMSDDASADIVRSFQDRIPRLRLVSATARAGAAHASNRGSQEAGGDLLVFCDADDVVGEGWLNAMVSALSTHQFVASRHETGRLNPKWLAQARKNLQSDGLIPYRHPPFLSHAGGAGLGVHRAVHESIGGFDENWPRLQDTDYCWRMQLSGVPLHFVPDAVMHVRYRQDLMDTFKQALTWGEYNVLLYKCYRSQGMPDLTLRDAIASLRPLFRLRPLRTRRGRAGMVWKLGWFFGRVKGSLKHRVLAL